jgi:hypothetical protein
MPNKILDSYKTLEKLFKAEQSAFEETNPQKLAALASQIQQYCTKVLALEESFPELSPDQIRAARELICRLQEHVCRSRTSWERYHSQLEEQRNLLQSSKRFVHQARIERSIRGSRISHSA